MRKENEFHDVELDVVQNELKALKHFKLFFENKDTNNFGNDKDDTLVWVGTGDKGCMSGDRNCEPGNGYWVDKETGLPVDYSGNSIPQSDSRNREWAKGQRVDSEGMFEYLNQEHVYDYRHKRVDLLNDMKGLGPSGKDARFMSAYAHLKADKHEETWVTYYTPLQERGEQGGYRGGESRSLLIDTPSMREMEGYKSYVNVANDLYDSARINFSQKNKSLQIGAAPGAIEGEGGQRRSSAGPRQVRPV